MATTVYEREISIADHITFNSINVIHWIASTLCKNLYTGATRRKLADLFSESWLWKQITKMQQNQLHAIKTSWTSTRITWWSAVFSYTKETQKAAKACVAGVVGEWEGEDWKTRLLPQFTSSLAIGGLVPQHHCGGARKTTRREPKVNMEEKWEKGSTTEIPMRYKKWFNSVVTLRW